MPTNSAKILRGREGRREGGGQEKVRENERERMRASERARETEGRKMCVSVRIDGYQREYVYTHVYMYLYHMCTQRE
jgi:hypothetical protein